MYDEAHKLRTDRLDVGAMQKIAVKLLNTMKPGYKSTRDGKPTLSIANIDNAVKKQMQIKPK